MAEVALTARRCDLLAPDTRLDLYGSRVEPRRPRVPARGRRDGRADSRVRLAGDTARCARRLARNAEARRKPAPRVESADRPLLGARVPDDLQRRLHSGARTQASVGARPAGE